MSGCGRQKPFNEETERCKTQSRRVNDNYCSICYEKYNKKKEKLIDFFIWNLENNLSFTKGEIELAKHHDIDINKLREQLDRINNRYTSS